MKFKTCKRYNDPGHAHELTFSCYKNNPFLVNEWICEILLDAIIRSKVKHNYKLWAFVFMPTHVHLLIYLLEEHYNISSILQSIKQITARKVIDKYIEQEDKILKLMESDNSNERRKYHFWQRGGGYDRNINKAETVLKIIDYIHNNPVRKGLVVKPEDWKWSSANEIYINSQNVQIVDRESLLVMIG